MIGLLISTVISYIIFGIVDPEAADELKIIILEKTKLFMERMGAPSDQVAETLKEMQDQDSMSLGNQLKQFAQGLIFF